MTQPQATLIQPSTLRFERLLPGPVERVWAYLTDPQKRAVWFCGGSIDLRVGGRVELKFDNNSLSDDKAPPPEYRDMANKHFTGTVTRLEPNKALGYTWEWATATTEVLFELEPRGKDVLLVVTHRLPDDRGAKLSVASGWDVHTGILEDHLRGVRPRPLWATMARLKRQYEAAL